MSYQNDSHKGGTHAKTGGSTKGGQNAKGGHPSKSGHPAKGSQNPTGSQQGRNAPHSAAGAGACIGTGSGGNFHAQDIKSLVRNQGRAKLGGQEWALKAPSWNDTALQTIISDPKFTVKPAGKSAIDGKWTYELCGHGKTLKVTIGC